MSDKNKDIQSENIDTLDELEVNEIMKKEMLESIENSVKNNPEVMIKALKQMIGKDG